MSTNPLVRLHALGQSIWLDFLGRGLLESGALQRLIGEDRLQGVTSNPAIFEKAIGDTHDYDDAIRALAVQGKRPEEIYELLTVEDIRRTADLFRHAYDEQDGRDGFVSLEVSPHLAHDTAGTLAEARHLWGAVDRPNLMIKVPGTEAGLPAIRQLIAEGVNVNVTLLFGLPRYQAVAEAYIAGLEEADRAGLPLARIASVASFFLSRIDVLIDPILEQKILAGGEQGRLAGSRLGQTAIACAKLAQRIHKCIFASERFLTLAGRGARTQRLLWASTGTKNPAYSDVKYVEPLVGAGTVNTLPMETLDAYRDHGEPALRLDDGVEEARAVLEDLPRLGIGLDAVTRQLEDEGVDKFIRPYDSLMSTLGRAEAACLACTD